MLPLNEQEMLIKQLQEDIFQKTKQSLDADAARPYSWQELHARVQESEEQIARGEVISEEDDDRMFDEYLQKELNLAV